jgi:hypothetical protein
MTWAWMSVLEPHVGFDEREAACGCRAGRGLRKERHCHSERCACRLRTQVDESQLPLAAALHATVALQWLWENAEEDAREGTAHAAARDEL